MPAAAGEEIPDEVKTYHEEVGEQGEEAPCERSGQVDLRDVKLGLINERDRDNERNRNADRLRMSQAQADAYNRQSMFAQAAAGLLGPWNNPPSPYSSYPMGLHSGLSPFGGGFPSVSPQLGGPMHLPRPVPVPAANHPIFPYGASFPHTYSPTHSPVRSPHAFAASSSFAAPHDPSGAMYYGYGSKMIPSPLSASPVPAAYLMNNRPMTSPPPAHRGVSCSPFPSSQPSFTFPQPMDFMTQFYMNQLRQTPPMNPSMAPHYSLFSPFRTMGSPIGMSPFSPQHYLPQSPDPNGRFSVNRHEVSSSRMSHVDSSASSTSSNRDHAEGRAYHRQSKREKLQSHVKKPLNAFMLYMKEMRASVQSECTLKESAAINQILGKKWHALDRAEQQKYYDMAKYEREMHAKNNPGWTAKDNYAQCGKKKRRKKEKSDEPKKCRAIFGIDRQGDWCKPCRRKKKCIRYSQNAAILANGGLDYINEPKSSASDSMPHVSSSMQTLSPSGDSVASSTSPSAASSG